MPIPNFHINADKFDKISKKINRRQTISIWFQDKISANVFHLSTQPVYLLLKCDWSAPLRLVTETKKRLIYS